MRVIGLAGRSGAGKNPPGGNGTHLMRVIGLAGRSGAGKTTLVVMERTSCA